MWRSLSIYKVWLWLVFSWFGCGLLATILGFTSLFYPFFSAVLIIPIVLILVGSFFLLQLWHTFSTQEKIVVSLVSLWWLLHSLQAFVPETGFDAVWYHLPLAQQTTTSHGFIGNPSFYQSFNPQFSDTIFYLGFAAAGEIGTKIIAYFFGLTLVFTSYILSRQVLNRTHSLLVVLLVSSFQVVSWQSSSFYIDIPKAVWELSALILILHKAKQPVQAGLLFGASLASKLFSLLLLPLMAGIAWMNNGKKAAAILTIVSLLVALPYYLFAYSVSGNAFYSGTEHLSKLQEIGGATTIPAYLVQSAVTIPLALWQLVVNKEYTTPLIIVFFPLLFLLKERLLKNKVLLSLVIFSGYQLLIWWIIPPTSTRYALSGFITATIFIIYGLNHLIKNKKMLFYGLLIVGVVAMPIRLAVATRSWEYITRQQTKQQYLQQFYDDNIDHHLKKWHGLIP